MEVSSFNCLSYCWMKGMVKIRKLFTKQSCLYSSGSHSPAVPTEPKSCGPRFGAARACSAKTCGVQTQQTQNSKKKKQLQGLQRQAGTQQSHSNSHSLWCLSSWSRCIFAQALRPSALDSNHSSFNTGSWIPEIALYSGLPVLRITSCDSVEES